MPSINQAAWLDAIGQPLRVGPAEMPTAGSGEVVVRNRAIAVNPVSWKIQDTGKVAQKWPVVLDYDIAGEVYEVGEGVAGFHPGDRVVALVPGPISPHCRHGAFQLYSVAKTALMAKLPDSVSFAEASVLPVCFNTAIVALSGPAGRGLGLPLPSFDIKPSGKTIVLWGASSAVGLQTLQVARAAGINVVATASKHNFDLCRACGAAEVLDYNSPSIVEDVIKAVHTAGGDFAGVIDCVSLPEGSLKLSSTVLDKLGGGKLAVLIPDLNPEVPDGIEVVHILGLHDITHAFWKDYVTPALEQGTLKCLPEPLVVGKGLESLQKALDIQKKGVSAKKVVVVID